MASLDDRLNINQDNQGLTRRLLNNAPQVMRPNNRIKPPVIPKPTTDQLQQWNSEAAYYANQGGGGTLALLKDYARNAGQLGSGITNIAGGTVSAPFLLGADYAENSARSILGADNPNPNKYRNESYNTVNSGINKVSDVAKRTGGGLRELLGWSAANQKNTAKMTPKNTKAEEIPYSPQQQANYNYYHDNRIQPTNVDGISQTNMDGMTNFTNIKPTFDNNGNQLTTTNALNIIPSLKGSLQRSSRASLENGGKVKVPNYNPGMQVSVIEDPTTGGYYQRKKADRENRRTREMLNNINKDSWGLNRQSIIDNSQLDNNYETGRLLSSQADASQRLNSFDKIISNSNIAPQQRAQALNLRNLLMQGGQRSQNNVVTKLSEEMPDGSKREKVVTVDPSTGSILGQNSRQVSRSYVSELAKKTGKTENEVISELEEQGVNIV